VNLSKAKTHEYRKMKKAILVGDFTLLFVVFRCFIYTKLCHNNISLNTAGSIADCAPAIKTGYQKDVLL
jgi:hypothetical protein